MSSSGEFRLANGQSNSQSNGKTTRGLRGLRGLFPGRDTGIAPRAGILWLNGLGTHERPEAVQKEKNEALLGGSEISLPPEHSA